MDSSQQLKPTLTSSPVPSTETTVFDIDQASDEQNKKNTNAGSLYEGYTHVLACPNCGFLTLNAMLLEEHVQGHSQPLAYTTFTCKRCNCLSTERSIMIEHVKIYHRNDEGPIRLLEERHCLSGSPSPPQIEEIVVSPGNKSPLPYDSLIDKKSFACETINSSASDTLPSFNGSLTSSNQNTTSSHEIDTNEDDNITSLDTSRFSTNKKASLLHTVDKLTEEGCAYSKASPKSANKNSSLSKTLDLSTDVSSPAIMNKTFPLFSSINHVTSSDQVNSFKCNQERSASLGHRHFKSDNLISPPIHTIDSMTKSHSSRFHKNFPKTTENLSHFRAAHGQAKDVLPSFLNHNEAEETAMNLSVAARHMPNEFDNSKRSKYRKLHNTDEHPGFRDHLDFHSHHNPLKYQMGDMPSLSSLLRGPPLNLSHLKTSQTPGSSSTQRGSSLSHEHDNEHALDMTMKHPPLPVNLAQHPAFCVPPPLSYLPFPPTASQLMQMASRLAGTNPLHHPLQNHLQPLNTSQSYPELLPPTNVGNNNNNNNSPSPHNISDSGSVCTLTGSEEMPSDGGGQSGGVGGTGSRPHRQNFTPSQNRVLLEWYQTHRDKPYPSTEDTKLLAGKCDLSYPQVKKWFANKRARSSLCSKSCSSSTTKSPRHSPYPTPPPTSGLMHHHHRMQHHFFKHPMFNMDSGINPLSLAAAAASLSHNRLLD